jgi:hypothetical protein
MWLEPETEEDRERDVSDDEERETAVGARLARSVQLPLWLLWEVEEPA